MGQDKSSGTGSFGLPTVQTMNIVVTMTPDG
jgi:hypothetical protein